MSGPQIPERLALITRVQLGRGLWWASMEAYLRIYKMGGVSFVERYLIGFEDEMTSHCIGSLPELFDGNPPFRGRGAVSLP